MSRTKLKCNKWPDARPRPPPPPESERLAVWAQPLEPAAAAAAAAPAPLVSGLSPEQWVGLVRTAWGVSPRLAVLLQV